MDYFKHESAYVDEGCTIGAGTKIWHFSHIMSGCTIGGQCNIGQNVVISPDVVLGRNCKMIVVACNTATAAAIDVLRKEFPSIPFIGLEPAVKPAALKSKSGVVGVLATAGTFSGRLYRETSARFAKDVTVIAAVADEFVTLVERGETSGRRAERIVRSRLEPLFAAGADNIVLGCTHFPHLKPLIEKITAGRAEIEDPSEAVARQAGRVLRERGILGDNEEPTHEFIRTKEDDDGETRD